MHTAVCTKYARLSVSSNVYNNLYNKAKTKTFRSLIVRLVEMQIKHFDKLPIDSRARGD